MGKRIAAGVVVGVAGIVVLGSIGFAVWDGLRSSRETEKYEGIVKRCERALAKAKSEAKEVIRTELRKREAKLAKEEGPEAVRRQKVQSKKRRVAIARKFFAGGFKLTDSYAAACRMPEGDPSAEEQEVIDLAGEAASEEDLETAADVLEAALKAQDPRARIAAVEMLSGLGEAGLADISEFLSDPHPEVANLAADRWELGIQDLMDEREQAAMAKVGYLAITDEDQLRSLGGTLMLVQDAKLAVDVLTEVIREGADVQRKAAKEAYESVTGEPWVDEKAAAAWLEENYVPPEPEEEDEPEDAGTEDLTETNQTEEQDNE